MAVEIPFNATAAANRWQEAIDSNRRFSEEDLYNISLDIIKIRADEAGIPFKPSSLELLGPADSMVSLSFYASKKVVCDTICVALVREGVGEEVLEITKKGRKGSERFETSYGLVDIESWLFGDFMNKEGNLQPITIPLKQRMDLARLLWAIHTGTPNEEFIPDDDIGEQVEGSITIPAEDQVAGTSPIPRGILGSYP